MSKRRHHNLHNENCSSENFDTSISARCEHDAGCLVLLCIQAVKSIRMGYSRSLLLLYFIPCESVSQTQNAAGLDDEWMREIMGI